MARGVPRFRDGVRPVGDEVDNCGGEHEGWAHHSPRWTKTTTPDPEGAAVDLVKRAFGPETVELDRVYVGDIT